MPELPEVQTIVSDLERSGLVGLKVEAVRVLRDKNVVRDAGCADIGSALCDSTVKSVSRRGKYIVLKFSNARTLLFHLRMTGKILFPFTLPEPGKHDHLVISFSKDKKLVFHDPRRFGRCFFVSNPDSILNKLGPEPLDEDFTFERFSESIALKKRRLKPLLLDQSFIAGLGNIYTDEALFLAGLHPCRSADTLTVDEQKALYKAIKSVLRSGIRNRGTSLGLAKTNFMSIESGHGANQKTLKVFRRTGQPCYACGAEIERILVAQRGTHICPHCQPL